MAATSLTSSSAINLRPAISTKLFSASHLSCTCCYTTRGNGIRISAKLGGGEEEAKKGGKKKFITKEQEPEQYYRTAGEREGENPMKTPLPWIIIFGMSTPFVILAIAFANGWIKAPIR
ncbi:hypothetical protein Leryth_005895 [Lithospermum erythrorhizon]|uniref:Uncharacterized protein n=1 Tax=Lithospermum erythrorhizon TaxID=34254 RepID=A0AAV3PYY7_LITER|nr:hypothetical protein Leryth_005895 [Lithospermum erythrorhizon]